MSRALKNTNITPVPMLDFSRSYKQIREEVLAEIEKVCDSQRFVMGPAVEEFERAAADACHVSHAVGCSSGTDALWLALAGIGIGEGDCVITTPFSFFASVSSILRAGATPVLADIDPGTFNLDPAAARRAAQEHASSKRKLCLMPVHLYGQCASMTDLKLVANEHSAFIVEDAAQAFGATWEGGRAGSLGDVAAFSFYPTKNLSAFGDAGLVTTSSEDTAEHIRSLRSHGMNVRYFHDEVGWNCRLDSIQAAVLSVKLRYLDAGNKRRRQLARHYDELFREAALTGSSTTDGIVLPFTAPRAEHIYHQYVIRAPRRDALREYLTQHGIGSEIYYPVPLHLQKALASLGYKPGDFPESERAAAEVLALPIYPELREEEQESVVEAIRRFYA